MTKHALITVVLLLSLFICASAQNRSARETLQGLGKIRLLVEYGQVDELEAPMRPTILQMLQDRARDRLREAEVPLATGDNADRPRLVFTVTLNKNSDTAPAILVESKLYERVHLLRDPAKQMEVATWVQSGTGGPRVRNEILFEVFDEQLKVFIRDYREVNPKPIPVEHRVAASPAQLSSSPNGLEGLKGTNLFVAFRPDLSADKSHRARVQKTLQKQAEARLAKAGIPLLTDETGQPLLYLFITLSPPNSSAPPIEIESAFWQQVRPDRDPRKQIYAVTWESRDRNGGPIADAAVLEVLNNQLDEFIKAYKAANSNPGN